MVPTGIPGMCPYVLPLAKINKWTIDTEDSTYAMVWVMRDASNIGSRDALHMIGFLYPRCWMSQQVRTVWRMTRNNRI